MEETGENSWILVMELAGLLRGFGFQGDGALHERLTIAQEKVMGVLFARFPEGVKLKDLAEELRITSGAASKTIDLLVQEGLVERHVSPSDRRAVTIVPSEAVRKIRDKKHKEFGKVMKEMLSKVSRDDRKTFIRVLRILIEQMARHTGRNILTEESKISPQDSWRILQ